MDDQKLASSICPLPVNAESITNPCDTHDHTVSGTDLIGFQNVLGEL